MAGLRLLAPSPSGGRALNSIFWCCPASAFCPGCYWLLEKKGGRTPSSVPTASDPPGGTLVSLITVGTTVSFIWILGRLLLEASRAMTFLLYSRGPPPSTLSWLLYLAQASTAFLQKVCSHLASSLRSRDPVYSCAPGPLPVGPVISPRTRGHTTAAAG